MIKNIVRWLLALAVLNVAMAAHAATFYVRAGASGSNNGTDWSNAWTQLSNINYSMLNPGDTVYIAAGTYGALNVAKSGSAGQPLTFKRATAGEHGTGAGWSDAFDGRVIIDGGKGMSAVGIGQTTYSAQNYITIDGATRYGIWIRNAYYGVRAGYGTNNLTLRYLEIGDPGTYKLDEDGIQGKGNNLVVEYSYVHDNDNASTHGDGIQWFGGDNVTLRYNVFYNNGQQIIFGVGDWNTVVNDVSIYYNVFYNRSGGYYNGIVMFGNSEQAGRYIHVYNNTFDLNAGQNDGYNSIFYPLRGNATVSFKNNAVLRSNANQIPNTVHNNNAFDNAGDGIAFSIPSETGRVAVADLGFVNAAAGDFRLAAGSPLIGKGVALGLTVDFAGKAVGAVPSIGAFEATTATSAAALTPPTNLTVQ